MELIIFLIIVAGIIYIIGRFKTPPAISYKYETPKVQAPEISISVTTAKDDPKYHYNPSEDVVKFLRALIYFGKADGQLREDELEVMARCLIQQQPEHKASDKWYLCSCIRDIKPFSTEQYNSFIKQLDKTSMKAMLTWYSSLSATQKKNHPFEDHLLQELQNMIAE